jgi:hypothetical protein
MPHIEEALGHLAGAFTVRDIMTPRADLVCATNDIHAGRISHNNPDFDVIPIQQDGALVGYFERKSGKTTKITPTHLIADGTSLLDLVEILEGRQFSFVLSRHTIECYVHFTAVRLKVEENQLVDVFGEIGFHIDGLKGA